MGSTTRGRRFAKLAGTAMALTAPLWSRYVAVAIIVSVVAALVITARAAAHQIVARDAAVARLVAEQKSAAAAAELERASLERQLNEQATRDPLTGLLHRAAFAARVDESLAAAAVTEGAGPRSVLVVDITRFAMFNEVNGAAVADELLLSFAARFAGTLRPDDAMARIDGDVFAALLEDVPHELVSDVAQRVVSSVRAQYTVGGDIHAVGVACGLVTTDPGDGVDAHEMLRRADVALQNAKATRASVVRFEPRIEDETRSRLRFHDDLSRALAGNELHLLYQPLYDVTTSSVHSVEALMRWRHPERGEVRPDEFIPVAEATGQIVEMGLWALAAACRQQRIWRTRDHVDIAVAVNFSARQLSEPDVIDRVRNVVTREALDPRRVKLEITESLVVDDLPKAIEVLTKLRALGLRLSVDDFGTGYSSLSRIGELPIDELKIDRYFVGGIGHQGPRETILNAAIAMGHALGLTVVAEGVETQAQLDHLRGQGCDYVQGYLLSRPVEPDVATQLFGTARQDLFGVPRPREARSDDPVSLVPNVMPSLEQTPGRRLFAR